MAKPTLKPTVAPNLINAPTDYNKSYTDNSNNVLRLYFNTIDNLSSTLVSPYGGGYLGLPHIAAYDSTSQFAGGNDTPTKVTWGVLSSSAGFTLNQDGTATALLNGVYKIDYSLQFANTINGQHDVYVWLKVDGVNVTESSSKFTLVPRKSAGVYSYIVAYSSITFEMLEGQSVGLWWATDLAAAETGGVITTDGVFMEALPAVTSPYSRPSNPSAVGSITFVSRINP